eukprot:2960652-Amphidinium_carterae.1
MIEASSLAGKLNLLARTRDLSGIKHDFSRTLHSVFWSTASVLENISSGSRLSRRGTSKDTSQHACKTTAAP